MTNPNIFDPTFHGLQNDIVKPSSKGEVVEAVNGEPDTYDVTFAGRTIRTTTAGKNPLVALQAVAIAQVGKAFWAVDSGAGYPSRWARPLGDFAPTNPAGTFLRYVLNGNPKDFTYQEAIVVSAPTANSLLCDCWDGQQRTMDTVYAGVSASSDAFQAGDVVLCYQPAAGGTGTASPSGRWEVVGYAGDGVYIEADWFSPVGGVDPYTPYERKFELAFAITPDAGILAIPEITGTLAFLMAQGTAVSNSTTGRVVALSIPVEDIGEYAVDLTWIDDPGPFSGDLSSVKELDQFTIFNSGITTGLRVRYHVRPLNVSRLYVPVTSFTIPASTSLIDQGTTTTNSTAGRVFTLATPVAAADNYAVDVYWNEDPGPDSGDLSVVRETTKFTIYNSGPTTGIEIRYLVRARDIEYRLDVLTQTYPLEVDNPGNVVVYVDTVATSGVTLTPGYVTDYLPSFRAAATVGALPADPWDWTPARSCEIVAPADQPVGQYLQAGLFLNYGIPWELPRVKITTSWHFRYGDGTNPLYPDTSGSSVAYADLAFTVPLVPYIASLSATTYGSPAYHMMAGCSLRLDLE